MRFTAIVFWCLILAPLSTLAVRADGSVGTSLDDFVFFTEGQPPYTYVEDGKHLGIASDMLDEILARSGSKKSRKDIVFVPWARGYAELQKRPNTMLFSMYLTEERKPLFKWVGPIITSRVVALARRDRAIHIDQRIDVDNYRTGLTRNGISYQKLLAAGVSGDNFTQLAEAEHGAQLLMRGRIDLWAADENLAQWTFRQAGQDPAAFEVVHEILENGLYFAFHHDTDDQLIERLQATLDQMKKDGTVAKITHHYLPETSQFRR